MSTTDTESASRGVRAWLPGIAAAIALALAATLLWPAFSGPPQAAPGASAPADAERSIRRLANLPSATFEVGAASSSAPNGQPSVEAPIQEPAADAVAAAGTPAAEGADQAETVFLTIVGDKTYVSRGREGQRPPRPLDLARQEPLRADAPSGGGGFSRGSAPITVAAASTPTARVDRQQSDGNASFRGSAGGGSGAPVAANSGGTVNRGTSNAAPSGGGDNPSLLNEYGSTNWDPSQDSFGTEAPNPACPFTLPPGSGPGDVAVLQAQGCRYISTCYRDAGCLYQLMGAG